MCCLAYRLGFTGSYLILDLPEFSALQRFYLKRLGLPLSQKAGAGIRLVSSVDGVVAELEASAGRSLFLASWSISEVPVDQREPVLALVEPFEAFLIGYANRFCEIDNQVYFQRWREGPGLASKRWSNNALAHLPGQHCLIGLDRSAKR